MEELIQQLTNKLGMDASVASQATGKAMAMLKQHAGDDLFGKISSAIPGAAEAAEQGASEGAGGGGGGIVGKLTGMASSMLGGSAGSGLELGAALSSAGVDSSQMDDFASTIVQFLKDKAGNDVVEQILAKVPMLKNLLG
ncbi:MAG: DUF2780 domain-containing protein [Planctomycetales bacterium]|nr:DUF2780 domain-containing protein [Planctomycetales bacterium]